MRCMHLIGDIIIPIFRWEMERADVNKEKKKRVCFSFSLVCVFESPEFGRVCHFVALGASVCAVVSAQCVCVEESLVFTELEEKGGR